MIFIYLRSIICYIIHCASFLFFFWGDASLRYATPCCRKLPLNLHSGKEHACDNCDYLADNERYCVGRGFESIVILEVKKAAQDGKGLFAHRLRRDKYHRRLNSSPLTVWYIWLKNDTSRVKPTSQNPGNLSTDTNPSFFVWPISTDMKLLVMIILSDPSAPARAPRL